MLIDAALLVAGEVVVQNKTVALVRKGDTEKLAKGIRHLLVMVEPARKWG